MKFEIKHRFTCAVMFSLECETMKLCVEAALKHRGSNLRGSDLSGSDLSGSDLSGSDLSYSNLRGSDLSYSDLRGSDLSYSNLRGAKNTERAVAYTRILAEGQIIGYKKGSKGEIIKLSIP